MFSCSHCKDNENTISKKNTEVAEKEILLKPKEAADYIGFTAGTLAVWRCTGRHNLRFVKIGRTIFYPKSGLDAFLLKSMQP